MSQNKTGGRRPNLLFIFADQWRRQVLGCVHADPVLTPHMDKVAAEGMVFENALSGTRGWWRGWTSWATLSSPRSGRQNDR